MERPGGVVVSVLRGVAALVLLAVALGGCDWFDQPIGANLEPETVMDACPPDGDVKAGDDVTVAWSGSDVDGAIVAYRWALDDTITGETDDTSLVIEDVAEGSHVFEVSAVDDRGDADSTPAVCEFTAGTAGGLVGRVVLVEFLTTFWCPNCPNGEEALNGLMAEYGRDSLCVVAYHDGGGGLSTAEQIARCDWYTDEAWPDGTPVIPADQYPVAIFDGLRHVDGSPTVPQATAEYRTEINFRRESGSPLSVRLSGDVGAGSVTIRVDVHDQLSGGAKVLRAVVVEDDALFATDLFDFVARDILDEEPLTVAAPGDSVVVTRAFAVNPAWNVGKLDVIAFVQDDMSREVLQACRLKSE
jgi:thiol-disulfide isomerase/thioredoxin